MATKRAGEARDPQVSETLRRHEGAWVPVFLARASLGLTSVVVASAEPAGVGSVALLSPAEASAWLKKAGQTRGSSLVAGTPSPGNTWCVGLAGGEYSVFGLAMTPILTRGAGAPGEPPAGG
jgi:hypothetical protein